MAIAIFLGGGNLGEGLFGGAEKENRILTEAARTARSGQDFSFHSAGKNGEHAAAVGQSEHANEARAPVLRSARLHFGEQLSDALCRGSARSCVAGGTHAGIAAEGIDDEPRVVGEHGQGSKAAVVQSLAGGVFGKGERGFLEGRQIGEIWQKLKVKERRARRAGGKGAKFIQLAQI